MTLEKQTRQAWQKQKTKGPPWGRHATQMLCTVADKTETGRPESLGGSAVRSRVGDFRVLRRAAGCYVLVSVLHAC